MIASVQGVTISTNTGVTSAVCNGPQELPPICGDLIVEGDEQCDDGNLSDDDSCSSTCTLPFCGDGVVDPGEECDDRNDFDGDGCTNACTRCGNGIVTAPEECDDGNRNPFDGCTNLCTTFTCSGSVKRVGGAVMSVAGQSPPPRFSCVTVRGDQDLGQQKNLDACQGEKKDIDGNGTLDCLTARIEDRVGTQLDVWCGRFEGESPHLRGFVNGDTNAMWGRCSLPEAQNEYSFMIQGAQQDGMIDCILSARWLNEEYHQDGLHDTNNNGLLDQYIWNYFLTWPVQPDPNPVPRQVNWEHYTRNSPPTLVANGVVPLGSPLPPLPPLVPSQGDGFMVSSYGRNACDLDRDGSCDLLDREILKQSLGLCLGDLNFEFLADADSDGCVTTNDMEMLFPNGPPTAICQDVTVQTDSVVCTASASVNDGSFDPDNDPLSLEQSPVSPYSLGSTEVALTVTDGKGGSDSCTATVTVVPRIEVCDGLDNNCNGISDDGFNVGTSCTVGIGICQRTGALVCTTDGAGTTCNATPGTPAIEICGDGIDQDCNGADLTCPPPPPVDTCTPTTVLDNFNRADGSIGNNWRGVTDTSFYRIAGNRLDVQAGGPLYWNPAAFGANQAAFVTLSTVAPNSPSQGVLLKVQSGSVPNAGAISVVYDAAAKAVRVSTLRLGALSWTPYGNTPVLFANGDKIGACAKANGQVRVYKNDTLVKTVTLTAADQGFFNTKGGKVGVWSVLAPQAFLDDFGGATIAP
jgi:cysteine-rich repeat protein